MSKLSLFLKQNQQLPEPVKKAVTASLRDENGEPLLWTLKPVTTAENDRIRKECAEEVPAKNGLFRTRVDTGKYIAKLLAASVVEPDLRNAELQDSYGVNKPEDLIREMIPVAGEYSALAEFVQELSGFDISMADKAEEAKN